MPINAFASLVSEGRSAAKPSIISCRGRACAPRSRRSALTPDELKKSSAGRKPFDATGCSGCWFYKRSTICRTSRWNIRCATGCRSALSGARDRGQHSGRHDALAVPREAGRGRNDREARFLTGFDQYLRPRAAWRVAGRSSTPSIVLVPTQRNSRDENAELQAGRRQRDGIRTRQSAAEGPRCALDKKHGRSFFGYRSHVNADAKHKLIRHYGMTDAAVHDSQELDELYGEG